MRLNVLVLSVAAAIAAICALAGSVDVDLVAADGTKLKATYMSPGRPGPAMLLVHQCNRDRSSWTGLGAQLVDAGVHVLTLDLRGFGDSEGEGMRGAGGFGGFLQKSSADVDMAYRYLVDQSGVDASNVAVGGASCGAMLTADLASRQAGVKTLMLLSGPPSDGAVQHIAATPGLAVFAAAASDDTVTPGVADRLRSAVAGSPNPRSTAEVYAGTEHGLPLFDRNADLEPALITWLETQLNGN